MVPTNLGAHQMMAIAPKHPVGLPRVPDIMSVAQRAPRAVPAGIREPTVSLLPVVLCVRAILMPKAREIPNAQHVTPGIQLVVLSPLITMNVRIVA